MDTGSIIECIDGVSGGERAPVIFTARNYDLRALQDELTAETGTNLLVVA